MKKSILSFAIAAMLMPQALISQDSMDVDNNFALTYQEEVTTFDLCTIKGDLKLTSLKRFELIDESANNVKVIASFLQKETFSLYIYNEAGLIIYEESFQTDELNLAMGFSNLPQGNYFISLKTSEGEIVRKFK